MLNELLTKTFAKRTDFTKARKFFCFTNEKERRSFTHFYTKNKMSAEIKCKTFLTNPLPSGFPLSCEKAL